MSKQSLLKLLIGSIVSIVLDQWTKLWAVQTLYLGTTHGPGGVPPNPAELYSKSIKVTSWFNYHLVGNKGAAWGVFKDLSETWRVPFFVCLSVVAIIVIVTLYKQNEGNTLLQSALILVLGGAIGNLIDRIQIGYVIDFIDWHYSGYHWPTFNIADVAISVGIGLLMIDTIRQFRRDFVAYRSAKASEEGGDGETTAPAQEDDA
jgi:signal peptidase II